ncbi:Lipopolysaccharide kinase (Kdo/WaaP) family protein [Malonomonas rubra DSM 5091]|uniref:Lipopolysaccharide kinase (Kdo/WaaP) family protein n=1 Tax=Malonomonas rubra DSM 5091 TaxID=1122189 RepID=A0A1M6C6Z9_MALRU|nr:lipopolysaccharide kinase InaA family protein [Malonomonas rubra]SHI56759.1 Lipopolysaccharide kinase (Kdo/WaaP) family protein [Malonomonas rubra DSM 5091]
MSYEIKSWPRVLKLASNDTLTCVAPLRDLPGKRMVCKGEWQDQPVVAKIFLDPGHGKRHFNREKKGIDALRETGISTPPLLFAGTAENQNPVLIFAELPSPQTALQLWQQAADDTQKTELLQTLLSLLAQHHQSGLQQKDLHLGNFLFSDDTWYTIDGDAVDSSQLGTPLDLTASLSNLALFFAQLPPDSDDLIANVLDSYTYPRGLNSHQVITQLTEQLSVVRTRRRQTYVKKSYRTCSEFIRQDNPGQIAIYRRDCDTERITELLKDPDSLIERGEILKDGNSATVVRIPHPDGDWVIKRYNYKSFWHGLKRCLRPTRAWRSWGNSHRLKISDIKTPKAVAVIEKRLGPLRLGAYFVCENLSAPDAQSYFARDQLDEKDSAAANLVTLFKQLHKLGIHHGDCKATNFLIHQQQPWVIDLDAMREYRSRDTFLRRYQSDRHRFLANWQCDLRLQSWFVQNLPS